MARSHLMRIVVAGLAIGAMSGAAYAQNAAVTPSSSEVVTTGHPQRDTLMKLMQPISLDHVDARLEDVILFIREFSGADIEPLWMDDANPEGLDKDKLITVKVNNVTVMALIERVLAQAADGDVTLNSWQLTEFGECQIGPKSRLNKFKRVEIYDVNDLLLEIPEYDEVPLIDLQSVLQSSGGRGGGGGGRSPFRDDQQQDQQDRENRKQERADEVVAIIEELVEPEQWQSGGGSGGTIRYWQGTLIVNAPDYMHRQLNGYPYWPKRLTQTSTLAGRRYVSLSTDNGISTIDGITQIEATAVVGGQIIRSGPGGGR